MFRIFPLNDWSFPQSFLHSSLHSSSEQYSDSFTLIFEYLKINETFRIRLDKLLRLRLSFVGRERSLERDITWQKCFLWTKFQSHSIKIYCLSYVTFWLESIFPLSLTVLWACKLVKKFLWIWLRRKIAEIWKVFGLS